MRLRYLGKQMRYLFADVIDSALGRRGPLVPPKRISFIFGDGDFEAKGQEFLHYFISLADLKPTDSALDVGCGIGRMALPLTKHLTTGTYQGFDIVKPAIRWCQQTITPRFSSFRFTHADIFNKGYNPYGTLFARQFQFPYPDASFDFAFLTSVFTHMLPPDIEHYLAELRRVLKPGGRTLITWFIVNRDSETLIDTGKSTLPLTYVGHGCRLLSAKIPENAVGVPEETMLELYAKAGFSPLPPYWGTWCGRDGMSYQDIVVTAPQRCSK